MSSFFARTTLLSLSFISAAAFGKTLPAAEALQGTFNAQSSKAYLSADVALDYEQHTLELSLQPRMPACKKGFACAQVMPEPVNYSLENVQSTQDRCGVIVSTASLNRLAVTLRDNRAYRCGAKPAQDAVLTVNGDRFVATDLVTAPVFEGVIRAELKAFGSERYSSGKLFLNAGNGHVQLTLQPVSAEAVTYDLEDAKTVIDQCGIIRTVAQFDQRPVDGIYLKVTINNNRNNTCPTFAPLSALDVVVEQAYFSRLEGKEVQSIDSFKAEDFALIKPAGK